MFHFDTTLFLWLNATATTAPWILALARFASLEFPQLLVAGTVGAFLVGDRHIRQLVLRVGLAMVVAWVIARAGQYLWPAPRPFMIGIGTAWVPHGGSAGFPSTHASVAFAFAAAIAAFSRRALAGVLATVAALLVGWSRISLGLHFPFDVLAGAAVGLLGAWISWVAPHLAPAVRAAHE